MDYADIKIKSDEELKELLSLEQAKLRQYLASAAERQLKNIRVIGATKRTIARILTEQAVRAQVMHAKAA